MILYTQTLTQYPKIFIPEPLGYNIGVLKYKGSKMTLRAFTGLQSSIFWKFLKNLFFEYFFLKL